MFRKIFGIGKVLREEKAPVVGSESIENQPVGPDEVILLEFAIGNLIAYLFDDLSGPRGTHVETLMTMLGAIAGFSAQHAIWETVVKTGKMPEHGGENPAAGAFVVAGTHTAEKYYFGDLLNSYLIPQVAPLGPGRLTLWTFTEAAVKRCGRQPMTPDDINEIFRNAAATVGTAQFGLPRLPRQHRPSMMPRNALNRAWPRVKLILSRDDAPGAEGRTLSPGHWPFVCDVVAQKLIIMAKDTLDPAISMRIVFEAAVPMSKVDPTTVP
jgi:hypothetical protein